MSERYPGGFMTQSPPVPTATSASGVWTLDQQEQLKQAGQWPANGPFYIEEVFSTQVYSTGPVVPRAITNGIDLANKGGLVWTKARNILEGHRLVDTVRGATKAILSNSTSEQVIESTGLTSFLSDGYTVSGDNGYHGNPGQPFTYASWTFRKQPKFFDIVTYTTVSGAMTIPHNLGSAPGCWIIKSYSAGSTAPDWWVTHRSIPSNVMRLNGSSAVEGGFSTATSTNITIANGVYGVGETIIIYLFAHDAGGFGLSGTDNVISCGSWAGNSSTQDISLGYEPQYILLKNATRGYNWVISDTMRGMNNTASNWVYANTTAVDETNIPSYLIPTATGFKVNTATPTYNASGDTYIYIAIRRGPMKVPTLATTVFNSVARTGTGATATVEPGFVTDLIIDQRRSAGGDGGVAWDRLRGAEKYLFTRTTGAEGTTSNSLTSFASMNGVTVGADSGQITNVSGAPWINWMFRRAPSFFDEVCFTDDGTGTQVVNHNLSVVPEMIIVKVRNNVQSWPVYITTGPKSLRLNTTEAAGSASLSPTATTFNAPGYPAGWTVVTYLFASAPGVSKVGSYTGTGTTQAIACGFTAGARFVLIKRTDSTGDWYVWDSARGIVAGNDPYLWLNSLNAEVTDTDYIDTFAAGFELSSTAPAAINASGGSYIFLAIS